MPNKLSLIVFALVFTASLFFSGCTDSAPPPPGVTKLSSLRDVNIFGVQDGNALVFDSDVNKWVPGAATGGSGSSTLSGLGDVNVSGVGDGNALVFDSVSGKWVPGSGGGSTSISAGSSKIVVTGGAGSYTIDANEADFNVQGMKGISSYYTSSATDLLLLDKSSQELTSKTIYVWSEGGSDSNGCTSMATDACKTLQHTIDTIKPIINNVKITIKAKGQFSGDGGTGSTVFIKRLMAGAGRLSLEADDYVASAAVVSATNTTITFATGTHGTDVNYWKNAWVTIDSKDSTNTAQGQMRQILSSTTSGANTVLTVAAWDVNPTNANNLSVSGRARIDGTGYTVSGITVDGALTVADIKGFHVQNFTDGENWGYIYQANANGFMSYDSVSNYQDDGYAVNLIGAGYVYASNLATTGCSNKAVSVTGGTVGALYSTVFYNNVDIGLYVASAPFGIVTSYFKGGTTSIFVTGNATLFTINTGGSDGSAEGMYAERGGQISITGYNNLTENADVGSFAFIG